MSSGTLKGLIGLTVRDSVTGFTGIVTGEVAYLTGCNQVLVQPKSKDGSDYVEPRWMDVNRVVVEYSAGVVRIPQEGAASNAGPDKPAPKR